MVKTTERYRQGWDEGRAEGVRPRSGDELRRLLRERKVRVEAERTAFLNGLYDGQRGLRDTRHARLYEAI